MPTKTKPKPKAKRPQPTIPRRHHLDRRVHQILAADNNGDDDELLTTQQVAQWFCISEQWLEIARSHGYGPPYHVIGPKTIRYRRGELRKFLAERRYTHTAEYR